MKLESSVVRLTLVVMDGAAVGGHNADGLGVVVAAAASKADNAVAALLVQQLQACLDALVGGVGDHLKAGKLHIS